MFVRLLRLFPLRLVLFACLLAGALAAGLLLSERRALRVMPTASVITAVRDLSRLETAAYHVERVIDLHEEEQRLYGLYHGEDAVLLVAAGDVVAGVDLGRLGDGDVRVEQASRRVTLRLPAPEIFSANLDEGHTRVHARRTDLLVNRDEGLEGKARQLAVASFEQAAREGGILLRARAQAERVLRSLLRELGAAEVRIEWR